MHCVGAGNEVCGTCVWNAESKTAITLWGAMHMLGAFWRGCATRLCRHRGQCAGVVCDGSSLIEHGSLIFSRPS